MRPDFEQSLVIEFDELFALKDRLGAVADAVRSQLLAAGLGERLEAEVFDNELELRGTESGDLLVRLDSYHLEISGAPPELKTHQMASLILEEAGAFRLPMVEAGFALALKVPRGHSLDMMAKAFTPIGEEGSERMLDRRFSMTWEWGTPTTAYSFAAGNAEDKEIFISFKAREGYMTLTDLQAGLWMAEQVQRFDQLVTRFLQQLGWESLAQ